MTAPLFEVVAVHCFACQKVVRDQSAVVAHDRMEEHYRTAHSALIGRLIGEVVPSPMSRWRALRAEVAESAGSSPVGESS